MKISVYPYLITAYYKSGASEIAFCKTRKVPNHIKKDNPVAVNIKQVFTDKLTEDEKEWMEIDTRLWDDRMR